MKKFLKAISGKTALYIVTGLAIVCVVLSIVDAIREGHTIDYFGIGVVFVAITGWASAISAEEKKNKEDK